MKTCLSLLAAAHVTVGVPAHVHVPGACCEAPWDPQAVEVRLARTN